MCEYIKLKDNPNLLGKKARFKNNLKGYVSSLWLQTGIIIQHEGVEHVGLSLKFDNPKNLPLDTCYIEHNSIELLEDDSNE